MVLTVELGNLRKSDVNPQFQQLRIKILLDPNINIININDNYNNRKKFLL